MKGELGTFLTAGANPVVRIPPDNSKYLSGSDAPNPLSACETKAQQGIEVIPFESGKSVLCLLAEISKRNRVITLPVAKNGCPGHSFIGLHFSRNRAEFDSVAPISP